MFNDLYKHLNIISILFNRVYTFPGFIATIKFKNSLISIYSILLIKSYSNTNIQDVWFVIVIELADNMI